MDSTEAYDLGYLNGKTVAKVAKTGISTIKPFAKLCLLGFGVLIVTGAVYPELTWKQDAS